MGGERDSEEEEKEEEDKSQRNTKDIRPIPNPK